MYCCTYLDNGYKTEYRRIEKQPLVNYVYNYIQSSSHLNKVDKYVTDQIQIRCTAFLTCWTSNADTMGHESTLADRFQLEDNFVTKFSVIMKLATVHGK
jgi:hypothetical protein